MPKYYCDYCDSYLTHDSKSVRKTHFSGRKHKDMVRHYYQDWLEKEAAKLIAVTQRQYHAGEISGTAAATMAQANLINAPLSQDLLAEVKARNKALGSDAVEYETLKKSWHMQQPRDMGMNLGFGKGKKHGIKFRGFAKPGEVEAAGIGGSAILTENNKEKNFDTLGPNILGWSSSSVSESFARNGGLSWGGGPMRPRDCRGNPMPQNGLNTAFNPGAGIKGRCAWGRQEMTVVNPKENWSAHKTGAAASAQSGTRAAHYNTNAIQKDGRGFIGQKGWIRKIR